MFEAEVSNVIDVSLSHITLNGWSLIREFEVICRRLEVNPTIHMFSPFMAPMLLLEGLRGLGALRGIDFFKI